MHRARSLGFHAEDRPREGEVRFRGDFEILRIPLDHPHLLTEALDEHGVVGSGEIVLCVRPTQKRRREDLWRLNLVQSAAVNGFDHPMCLCVTGARVAEYRPDDRIVLGGGFRSLAHPLQRGRHRHSRYDGVEQLRRFEQAVDQFVGQTRPRAVMHGDVRDVVRHCCEGVADRFPAMIRSTGNRFRAAKSQCITVAKLELIERVGIGGNDDARYFRTVGEQFETPHQKGPPAQLLFELVLRRPRSEPGGLSRGGKDDGNAQTHDQGPPATGDTTRCGARAARALRSAGERERTVPDPYDAGMSEPVLDIQQARKTFGSTIALDGVDLSLGQGEWLGLLGPNGAGKTTLVKAIAGRVKLDGGVVRVFDHPVTAGGSATAEMRARLGIVPQEVALYPRLTGRENLEVFASLSGLAGAVRGDRVEWALDFTGLADRARDLVKAYSGGMKRRLNIACSVMHRPEIILLDEPTVGVDPQSRERIWHMLAELRKAGASLLLTSHQLDEVERVCERIIIIDHGKVIAEGALDALIAATIGRGRQVTIILDRNVEESQVSGRFQVQGRNAVCTVENVAAELPAILSELDAAGHRIEDVQINTPTLQAVFIHLTGRELRE